MNHRYSTAACAVLLALAADGAHAIAFQFEWQGNAGYTAKGAFGYDETTSPTIISESGSGPTNHLDFLSVSFFDPSATLLQSFDTVLNGVSNSAFFAFNFDSSTQDLFGAFNIGGGVVASGVQFFNGTIGGLLRLRENVDTSGSSRELDRQDPGSISVTSVPEPATFTLVALGLLGVARRASRNRAA